MVFHCRCFSFLLEQDEYDTRTQTKSTTTGTFYTAGSDFKHESVPISHATEKPINIRVFTLAEVEAATDNFCTVIGRSEFGKVYKGVIKSLEHPLHDIQVAVKHDRRYLQRHKEWEKELNVLGAVEHPNLVKLIGYYEENNGLVSVYEYMVNGNVRDHLSAKSETPLPWTVRMKVAQDVACGLTYLHEETDFQIIVKNFKSSNILLDNQWNAKLSDYGVSQILDPYGGDVTHISTEVVGSAGYTAPDFHLTGNLTSKSDVWSYGVFLCELLTGRRAVDRNRPANEQLLVDWVKPYLESKRFNQIVDPRLEGNYPLESTKKLCIIANKCLSENPKSRPKSEVLGMLNQLITVPISQATGPASPQLPQVEVDPNKACVGSTHGEKANKEAKHEGQICSMKIQLKKPECFPQIRPMKLLKSCSKKCGCVSMH